MEAIILVGGLGTRLRTIINDRPKALAPINGRPFLELLLSHLADNGFRRIILATGYLGEQIQDAVGHSFAGMAIDYSQEDKTLGTGGALAKAMRICSQDCVFAMNGDTWLVLDFHGAYDLWHKKKKMVLAGTFQEDVSRYGKLEISDGQVLSLSEKNASGPGWINAGCYVLPTDLFATAGLNSVFSFEIDFLPAYLTHSPAWFFPANCKFHDIGVPESYKYFADNWAHMARSN